MNNSITTVFAAIQPAKRPSKRVRLVVVGLITGLAATAVLAQSVYRIVGPDGRITYSDKPPPAQTNAQPIDSATKNTTASTSTAQLPFALRQVANRYPVTLYTSTGCAPCNSGRNLLNRRGIPYVEKTITTQQDADALQRVSGATSLPFLTIGTQQIKGYSDTEWTQFFDAAGYPKESILPSNYQRPVASPLVVVEAVAPSAAAPAGASRESPAETVVPVSPPTENPAGIRF